MVIGAAAVAGAATVAGGATRAHDAAAAPLSSGSTAYWAVGSNGQVASFGSFTYGDERSAHLSAPIIGAAAAPTGTGYWMLGSDGGIFTFGSAAFHGSEGGQRLPAPIVAMAADPATGGYWMVGSKGALYAFDAPNLGGANLLSLFSPIVGMASTPDGGGYWLVASDGGVFSFGDARFYGSMGGHHLDQPVVGMTPTADGKGYWLVASDGGVFSFGDARFYGSEGGKPLVAPISAISATPDGRGYWMVGRDGGIFTFGDAPFLGSAFRAMAGSAPVVDVISTGNASLLPPNSTGYDVSQWQCPAYSGSSLPAGPKSFAVTQVSGGSIQGAQPAGCYSQEASWAAPNQLAYIFMDPVGGTQAPRSMAGPRGACASSDLACQSYNFGYNWAQYWVSYAEQQGADPGIWFLDVETSGGWSQTASAQTDNSDEIVGAIDGLRADGVVPGIYSTNYQWGLITGNQISEPGIPLWMAGASNLGQAQQICQGTFYPDDYGAFAGGRIVMVQWVSQYDQDYACP